MTNGRPGESGEVRRLILRMGENEGSEDPRIEPSRFRGLKRIGVLGVEVPVAAGARSRLLGLALLHPRRAGAGLLIPRCRAIHTLGMLFALDLVFLDADGTIVEVRRAVAPGRFARCGRAAAVLELPSAASMGAPEHLGRVSGEDNVRPARSCRQAAMPILATE